MTGENLEEELRRLRAELDEAKRVIAELTKRAVLAETALALKSAALNDVLMKL